MYEAEFSPPDWDAPLDSEARVRLVPDELTIKGLVFSSLVEAANESPLAPPESLGSYQTFGRYPLSELIALVPRVAQAAYPNLSLRRGVAELGRRNYRSTRDSMAGKVLFAFAGRDFVSALKLVGKIYGLVTTNSVTAKLVGDREAIVELRGMWVYPDCYHVGVFQEALDDFELRGEIQVRRHTTCDTDLQIRWE